MGSSMEKREYSAVDITKFICAVIVVAGHCYLADAQGFAWFTRLVEIAVQIFFIFSGYFLVKAGTLVKETKAETYVKHLLGMTVIWMIPYFVLNLLITDKSSGVWVYDFVKLWTEFFSSFNSGHLWYLQNLLLVVVLLLGLKKESFSEKEALSALVLTSVFYGRFTRAVLGIVMGIYIATAERADGAEERKSHGRFLAAAGILAAAGSLLWMTGVHAAVAEIMANYLGNVVGILLAYAALCTGKAAGSRRKKTHGAADVPSGGQGGIKGAGFLYLRKQSTLVYLVHLLFVPFAARVMNRVLPQDIVSGNRLLFSLLLTLLVLACSVIFGAVVIRLSKSKRFSWLNYLY